MSRTIQQIQQDIITAKAAAADLSALEVLTTQEQIITSADSSSKVAIWRLWVYIFAFVLWIHEQIVEANAKNSRPQNLPNFIATVLNYYDGLDLVWKDGSFQYDLTNVADAGSRQIIARTAVLESNDEEIVVKVATLNGGDLQPLTSDQANRLLVYLKKMKVPGIPIRLVNQTADLLRINITVYVNTLIIDTISGNLLNTTDVVNPVQDAINNYLASLSQYELNGIFVNQHFLDTILKATGVELVEANELKWKYAAYPFQDIDKWKVSEAGYFKINDADLIINYLPYGLVNG